MDDQTTLAVDAPPIVGFHVFVPGEPRPWQRARSEGKRRFTSKEMEAYRNHIFARWAEEGMPKLHAHHWRVHVVAKWVRPASHYLVDGRTLSAQGRKMVHPSYCDLDNVLKHIDVFVKAGAVSDDRYAVRKIVEGQWASRAGVMFLFTEADSE